MQKAVLKIFNKNSYSLLTLFMVGAAVLVFEIGGTRLLAPFYGSTIFVWSSLITVTLGFLALGYFCGGLLADKYPRIFVYYWTIFAAAASAIALIKLNRYLLVFSDDFGFKYGPLVASLLIFALPLFLFSMSSPILIRLNSEKLESSGYTAGFVFGISTLGSLVGSLLAGFFLIPNYSLSAVLIYSNIVLALLALLGLAVERLAKWQIFLALLLLVFLYLCPVFQYQDSKDLKIIHQESSFYADLKVAKLKYADMLLMDGVAQSVFSRNTKQVFANESLQIKRQMDKFSDGVDVLVLGFGAGTAAKVFDSKHAVDFVELDPKMLEIAQNYFSYQSDENDQVIIADARKYLRETDKKYDVIFVDLYHSSTIPVHTHTKEALMLMSSRLKPDGLVFSNILGEANSELIQSLSLTLADVFSKTYFSSTQDGFTNILAYATNDKDFQPDFGGRHKEIIIDKQFGKVITDDRNPLEAMSSERLDDFLKATKNVLGYEAMFAI